ncbi:MAG TPA: hypothetical protein VGH99_02960 [Pseudonocardia sp.]
MAAGPAHSDSAPGARQQEFVTRDPEEAHAFLCDVYVDNTMRISGGRDGFTMRHMHRYAGPLSTATLLHTMSVQHDAQPLGYLLLGRVRRGRFERDTEGESLRAGRDDVFIIAAPDRPYVARWDKVDLQLTVIDQSLLADVAGRELDVSREVDLRPAAPGHARYLNAVLDLLTDKLLADPEVPADPLLTGSAARMLTSAVAATFFPGAAEPTRPHDRTDATPTAVRRAVAFIDSRAHTDIGVTDIAESVRVSPSALRLAFRRHLDTTPGAYLRRVRQERARDELRRAGLNRGIAVGGVGGPAVGGAADRWMLPTQARYSLRHDGAVGVPAGEVSRD